MIKVLLLADLININYVRNAGVGRFGFIPQGGTPDLGAKGATRKLDRFCSDRNLLIPLFLILISKRDASDFESNSLTKHTSHGEPNLVDLF